MVSGAQAENCDLSSTPSAAAAAWAAPVWRASVAPSPALPPICMYMTRPLPIGSSAEAGTRRRERRRGDAGQEVDWSNACSFLSLFAYSGPPPVERTRLHSAARALPNLPNDPSLARNACRRCGSSTYR